VMRCTEATTNNVSRARSNDTRQIGMLLLSSLCFTSIVLYNLSRTRGNDTRQIGMFLLSSLCFTSIVLYNLFKAIFLASRSCDVPGWGGGDEGNRNGKMVIIHVISSLAFDRHQNTLHLVCVFFVSSTFLSVSCEFFLVCKKPVK
jgi:hypothetical protein